MFLWKTPTWADTFWMIAILVFGVMVFIATSDKAISVRQRKLRVVLTVIVLASLVCSITCEMFRL